MTRYMWWFTAIVAGSFFIALLSRFIPMRRPNGLRTDPLPNPIGFLIPAAAFAIFSGLRINIGDTGSYVHSYRLAVENSASIEPIPFRIAGNAMFGFLQNRLIMRSDEPYTLIMVMSILAVVPVVYILYKYSAPYELAIALFVLTGYYMFSMNGIRQYAAAGILMLGTKFLFSEKKTDLLFYLPFVLLAWTFHSSALIMIPIYFIVRRRSWSPFTIALLLGTVILTLAFNSVLPTFLDALENTDYSTYAENGWFTSGTETGSNFIRVIVLAVPLVLSFLWRDRLNMMLGKKWDILVNLSVLNLAFYILSLYNWIFARLAIYTSAYVIIMMVHLLSKGARPKDRSLWYTAMVGMYIVYFTFASYAITGYRSELY